MPGGERSWEEVGHWEAWGHGRGASGLERKKRAREHVDVDALTPDVQFNPRWHEFGPAAVRGSEVEAV